MHGKLLNQLLRVILCLAVWNLIVTQKSLGVPTTEASQEGNSYPDIPGFEIWFYKHYITTRDLRHFRTLHFMTKQDLKKVAQQLGKVAMPIEERESMSSVHPFLKLKRPFSVSYALNFRCNIAERIAQNDLSFTPYFFKDETLRTSIQIKYKRMEALLKMKTLSKEFKPILESLAMMNTKAPSYQSEMKVAMDHLILDVNVGHSFKFGFEPLMDLEGLNHAWQTQEPRERYFVPDYATEEKAEQVYLFFNGLHILVNEHLTNLVGEFLLSLKKKEL